MSETLLILVWQTLPSLLPISTCSVRPDIASFLCSDDRDAGMAGSSQMVSVADDDHHVSIIVYFLHVASTVSASA